jgi:hypothetical protein
MKTISERALPLVGWLAISFATVMLTLSLIFLNSLHVDVVTQSPFFLYDDAAYASAVTIVTVIMLLLSRLNNDFYCIVLLFILWFLFLTAPYAVYMRSLPLYNDQLGFVGEAVKGALFGHVAPLQGEFSSLGHAYFSAAFAVICGLNPLHGVVAVQMLLPVFYLLPLLTIGRKHYKSIYVPSIVLAAILNPFNYGRTPFAWASYLSLFTTLLYNASLEHKRGFFEKNSLIVYVVIYAAFLVSDPTSLIVPIILLAIAIFDKRFMLLAILTSAAWFVVNLVLYASGSLYSAIVQLMALIEQPANPLPTLIVPTINPVMKLYNYLIELTIFIGFLIGFIASMMIIFGAERGERGAKLGWAALYYILVALQAVALAMNRWGMVPYSIYVSTALPVLVSITESAWYRNAAYAVALLLLTLSPVVKWGFSPIAFPTANDLFEATFLAKYTAAHTRVCASGAHVLLDFYFWLHSADARPISVEPLPALTKSKTTQCDCIATFYKTFNTYRLDISKNLLANIIEAYDNQYNVIYKNGIWTIWLR